MRADGMCQGDCLYPNLNPEAPAPTQSPPTILCTQPQVTFSNAASWGRLRKPAITPQVGDLEGVVGADSVHPTGVQRAPKRPAVSCPQGLRELAQVQSCPKALETWFHPVQPPADQLQARSVRGGYRADAAAAWVPQDLC